jgi:hypothetical protein
MAFQTPGGNFSMPDAVFLSGALRGLEVPSGSSERARSLN